MAQAQIVRSYDAKVDSKKRITLKNAEYEYYHVDMFDDGSIRLEARELIAPSREKEKD